MTGQHKGNGKRGLSKSRLISFRQCPKRLWLETFDPGKGDSSGAEAAIAHGNAVGEIARRLHPGGMLIDGETLADNLASTAKALAESPQEILFEATFDFDRTLVRPDILIPQSNEYRLVEVKASTEVKEHYPEDVAIQAWVLRNAGINLGTLQLAYVDNSFIYPGNEQYEGLLAYEDIQSQAEALIGEVPDWIELARETLAGDIPDIKPGPQCKKPYDCPFTAFCSPPLGKDAFPLSDLPRGGKIVRELAAEGFSDLREVPAGRLSNGTHQKVHRAANTGEVYLDPQAIEIMQGFGWPRRYLDFETIQFAVPIWEGTRPYQQIPFQWSCHMEIIRGEINHKDFLAVGPEDPRRAFAESLIEVLGADDGPIFVYNMVFERSRMQELAAAFVDLAPALEAAIHRLVDLYPIMLNHYYHPDQHGSWSIKAVLPTIAPDLDYSDLAVSEGKAAAEAFRDLIIRVDGKEIDEPTIRCNLRQYCERDTYGLVRIAEFLEQGGALDT